MDAHSRGKCALEQASGSCICNSRPCLEHLLPWQQGWRGSCRAKGNRVAVPSCAMSCSLPPDKNWCSCRAWPGAAAVMLCQLDHSAGSACAAVWGSSAEAKQTRQDEEARGIPAQGLMQRWLWENMVHGLWYLELSLVSESWVGRTKGLSTWTGRREVGCGVSNSRCSAQWGCAVSALLRAAFLSQKTLRTSLPCFFSKLCFVTCLQ